MIYSNLKNFSLFNSENIPVDSLLQSDFMSFTGTVQTFDLPIISLVSFFYRNFETFYCNIVLLS